MQNKPNFRSNKKNTTFLLAKDYEQITMNNEPIKQTQTKPNKLGAKRRSPTGELLGILKPGTNQSQTNSKRVGWGLACGELACTEQPVVSLPALSNLW
jgi:hypothetical protein